MRREDLRVREMPHSVADQMRPVTAAEFDALARAWALERGWVEPPDCENPRCDNGNVTDYHTWIEPCPSCGGSGKQRMVTVGGIDVEATDLRAAFTMLEELMDMAPTDEDCRLLKVIDRCVGVVARLVIAPDEPSRNIYADLAAFDAIDVEALRAIEASIARCAWWRPPAPDLEAWEPMDVTGYEVLRWEKEGLAHWIQYVAQPLFRTILAAMHSPAAARPPHERTPSE